MGAFRPPADAWSRRDFMRNGSLSIALLCTFGTTQSLKGPKVTTSAARRAQAGSPFEPFQRDLPIAPELSPVSTTQGVDVYEIAIREGMAEILPGFQTPIYGYEGIYPGPTIRARKGREAIVRQHNTLPFESNVHLHGGYVPAAHDGHPMDVIEPGVGLGDLPGSGQQVLQELDPYPVREAPAYQGRSCSASRPRSR